MCPRVLSSELLDSPSLPCGPPGVRPSSSGSWPAARSRGLLVLAVSPGWSQRPGGLRVAASAPPTPYIVHTSWTKDAGTLVPMTSLHPDCVMWDKFPSPLPSHRPSFFLFFFFEIGSQLHSPGWPQTCCGVLSVILSDGMMGLHTSLALAPCLPAFSF